MPRSNACLSEGNFNNQTFENRKAQQIVNIGLSSVQLPAERRRSFSISLDHFTQVSAACALARLIIMN